MINHNIWYGKIEKVKSSLLIFSSIAICAFIIRLVASMSLPINAYEASILLDLLDYQVPYSNQTSIIETLIIRLSFFFFGEAKMAARIWSVIVGSALIYLPFILRKKINFLSGLVLSLFITFDPFMIVNSIQVGSNVFSITGLLLFLSAIWIGNITLISLGIVILILFSRNILITVLVIVILKIFDKQNNWEIFPKLKISKEFIRNQITAPVALLRIAIFLLIAVLVRINLSNILSGNSIYSLKNVLSLANLSMNAGLLVVLFSYSPFYVSAFLLPCIILWKQKKSLILLLVSITAIVLLSLLISSTKNYSDLVWLELPILIGAALLIPEYIKKIDANSPKILPALIISIGIITLLLSIGNFIHLGYMGGSQLNPSINILTTLVLFIFGYISCLYLGKGKEFSMGFGISGLSVLLIIQLSFAVRASGLAGDFEKELLWSGNIADSQTIEKILSSLDITKEFAAEKSIIGVEDTISSQLNWIFRNYETDIFHLNAKGPSPYQVIITENDSISLSGYYLGQQITSNSYPKWIETPFRSLFDYDYWSWLFFRRSELKVDTNYLWLEMN